MKRISRILLIGPPLALLVACAATPTEDTALEETRERYSQLSSDKQIQSTAPDSLFDAEQAIMRAAEAEDEALRNHQLYLADQYMDIARTTAQRQKLENNMQALIEQRNELRLRAREKELEEARAELAALEAEGTARGLLVTLNDVFFETAQAQLNPGVESQLDQLATFMRKHPDQRVVVEGHTDSRGPEDYNRLLSERRAESVEEALQARGVDPERIVTRGLGESRPIASNRTSGGRQLNRRVEIVFPEYRES